MRFPTNFLVFVPAVTGGGDFAAIRFPAEFPVAFPAVHLRCRLQTFGVVESNWAMVARFLFGNALATHFLPPKVSATGFLEPNQGVTGG